MSCRRGSEDPGLRKKLMCLPQLRQAQRLRDLVEASTEAEPLRYLIPPSTA